MPEHHELVPRGPFSRKAAAEFGFGRNRGEPFDGAMRLAFPVDGGRAYAGAVLRQPEPDGPVEVELRTAGDPDPQRALELFGFDTPPTIEPLQQLAERWRPFRTWTTVLIRLGGDRTAQRPERV